MKVSINNKKIFKYKGVVHIVGELEGNLKGFEGSYLKRDGIKYCLINSNLSPMEKRRTLHNLIKDKHLTRG